MINQQVNISQEHFKEWHEQSKVHADIIRLNVKSISGDNAYEHLLYGLDDQNSRKNDGRLKDHILRRYDHLNHGGWWCSVVDLLTFEASDWGCFKPNKPRKDFVKQNKLIKYETPEKVSSEVFALNVPDEVWSKISDRFPSLAGPLRNGCEFWREVIDSKVPILITEGAKKAGAGLTAGYVTIALPGIDNGYRSDEQELIPQLQALCKYGREIVFAFDADVRFKTRQDVARSIIRTGLAFEQQGCSVSIMQWESKRGKGMDDFLLFNNERDFNAIFDKRESLETYIEANDQPRKFGTDKQFLLWLEENIGDKLEFNDLTKRVEYDGTVLEFSNKLRFFFAEKFNIEVCQERLFGGLTHCAEKNTYHPVKRYLEKVYSEVSPISLDDLADRYLGTTEPVYNAFVKRWLIAAVARVFEPGCQVDYALILQGPQGIRKTSFFNTLGGRWFNSCFGNNLESTKSLMVLHKCWIQEWGELDRIFGRNEIGTIKNFISNRIDSFVKPYGYESEDYPRSFVFCGTTNKDVFLKDETGDRRFLVIPLPRKGWFIPTDLLEQERDAIWASAVHEYLDGRENNINCWDLTREESELLNMSNEQFRVPDEWEPMIEEFLELQDRATIAEILVKRFHLEEFQIDQKVSNRVRDILRKLGWTVTCAKTKFEGKRRNVWEKPEATPLENLEDIIISQQGCPPSNPDDTSFTVEQGDQNDSLDHPATKIKGAPSSPDDIKVKGSTTPLTPLIGRNNEYNSENTTLLVQKLNVDNPFKRGDKVIKKGDYSKSYRVVHTNGDQVAIVEIGKGFFDQQSFDYKTIQKYDE